MQNAREHFGPPKNHFTTTPWQKEINPPVKLANPIDFHLWFLPLSPLSPGDFCFWLRIFLVPGYMKNRVGLWRMPWEMVGFDTKTSPTKTCKTYTMLDLWEDEDAWKETGVPYWAVMLEFRVNGDNYFTPNFCTNSFREWHHPSTNHFVISSHPPHLENICFLQGSPWSFGDK